MPLIGVNIKQNKRVTLLFTILGVITISLGGYLYLQRIKHNKSRREVEELDKEIKKLQLADLKKKTGSR